MPHDEVDQIPISIKGDSMAGSILPEDLVLVRRGAQAELGEIVVAIIDDEATVHPQKLRVPVGGHAEISEGGGLNG